MQQLISFLTDFGLSDTYVGQCKGVIAAISPRAVVVDICHAVPPYDIASGAYLLSEAVPYFPVCVHVAVVDPGVGGARRPIGIECVRGDVLIGPDNGLLLWAAQELGGINRAVELTEARFRHQPVSPTFHARDIFCPAAAHLVHGVGLHLIGSPIATGSLAPPRDGVDAVVEGSLHTRVVHVDHYGTLILAARSDALEQFGNPVVVTLRIGDHEVTARVGATFSDVEVGVPLVLAGSTHRLSLARNQASMAALLGLSPLDRPDVLIQGPTVPHPSANKPEHTEE